MKECKMQRIFDILFSVTALIFLSPLLLCVIIILVFTGEGEVFFVQNRVGLNGRFIKIFKFATMLKNSPNLGTGTVTIRDDPRVLPVGRFLRKTKINELPQLFNVVIGDMSLIGPRPQTQRCFEAFPEDAQAVLKTVRPGLSGIGSIFFRHEEKMLTDSDDPDYLYDCVIMPYKGELEKWYISKNSLSLYFMLIFLTVKVIISSDTKSFLEVFSDLPQPPDLINKFFN